MGRGAVQNMVSIWQSCLYSIMLSMVCGGDGSGSSAEHGVYMAILFVQYHALNGLRWRWVGEQCRTWCLYGTLVSTVLRSQWFEVAMGRGAVQNMVSIWHAC